MDKRTTGIIATIAAVLLCGFPGLVGLCVGAVFALVAPISGADIDIFGRTSPRAALGFGIFTICLSIIFIAIPVVVGVLTLRNKSKESETGLNAEAGGVSDIDIEPEVKTESPGEEETKPDEGESEDLPDPLG